MPISRADLDENEEILDPDVVELIATALETMRKRGEVTPAHQRMGKT